MENNELKPCPHCGCDANLKVFSNAPIFMDENNVYEYGAFVNVRLESGETINEDCYVECENDKCSAMTLLCGSSTEAIAAWNARIPDIVFCRDCKFWSRLSPQRTDGFCNELSKWHDAERPATEESHFCGYGRRKETL